MQGRARRANANTHPGQIVIDQMQTRRTREQIDIDEAKKAAEKVQALKVAADETEVKLTRAAQIESLARKQDQVLKRDSIRPDLAAAIRPAPVDSATSSAHNADVVREGEPTERGEEDEVEVDDRDVDGNTGDEMNFDPERYVRSSFFYSYNVRITE